MSEHEAGLALPPQPPIEEPAAEPPAAGGGWSRRRTGILVAIVVLALVTGVFAWGATKYSRTQGDLNDVTNIRSVAGDFGSAALTYDYRDLKPFEQRMKAHATGTFRRQLTDGLSGLETLITTTKSVSAATVKQIYVGDVEGHNASALVVVEARASNGDSGQRTVPAAYLELQLVKVGKHWLIDGVSTLDLGQTVPGASLPGTATTTTAPSK